MLIAGLIRACRCGGVFIEGKVADENAYIGRTYRDAPNVDGYIFINTYEYHSLC